MNGATRWSVLVIGGGAAVGKTTVARAVAERYRAIVVPVDAVWLALKAVTIPDTHPELHYFDPSDDELRLPPQVLCDRHIESAHAISQALDPVLEHYLWERLPVVLEGAWITPVDAKRWTDRHEGVRAVFIHEPELDEILVAMQTRSAGEATTSRQRALSRVCWLYGNWVRDQALARSFPVVAARPRGTLLKRVVENVTGHDRKDRPGAIQQ